MSEEREKENEDINECHENSSCASPDSKCIAGPSSSSQWHNSCVEKVTPTSTKPESEVASEVGSWSGPEVSSGPDSWGDADNCSWFENKNGLINAGQNLTNDNDFVSQTNITNKEQFQDKVGEIEFEEDVDNSVNIEDRYLPGNGVDFDKIELDSSRRSSNLNDNSEQRDEHIRQNGESRDNILNVARDNEENGPDKSLPGDVSGETCDGKATDGVSSNLANDSFISTFAEEPEDSLKADVSEEINANDELNNLVLNELEAKDALDTETSLQDISDAKTNLVDNDKVDDTDNFQDENVSEKDNDNDLESNSLNMNEKLDEEILQPTGNQTLNKNKETDGDNLSSIVLPFQDPNPQSALDNNVEIAVDMDDDRGLEIREEDNEQGCTILEVWAAFAMIAGAMPYWISNDGRKTEIQRNKASKVNNF